MAIRHSIPSGRGKDDPTFGPGRMPSEMTHGPVLSSRCWICDEPGTRLKAGLFGCGACGVGWAVNTDAIWGCDGVRGVRFWDIGILTIRMSEIGIDVRGRYDGSWDTHYDARTVPPYQQHLCSRGVA